MFVRFILNKFLVKQLVNSTITLIEQSLDYLVLSGSIYEICALCASVFASSSGDRLPR